MAADRSPGHHRLCQRGQRARAGQTIRRTGGCDCHEPPQGLLACDIVFGFLEAILHAVSSAWFFQLKYHLRL